MLCEGLRRRQQRVTQDGRNSAPISASNHFGKASEDFESKTLSLRIPKGTRRLQAEKTGS